MAGGCAACQWGTRLWWPGGSRFGGRLEKKERAVPSSPLLLRAKFAGRKQGDRGEPPAE